MGEALDVPPVAVPAGLGEVEVIDLDIPQSTIRFGLPGLLRKDPDFVPATVLNHILGGVPSHRGCGRRCARSAVSPIP